MIRYQSKQVLTALLFIFFLILCERSLAQEKLITANFKGLSIAQLVADIESKTDYRFYFDPVISDSLKIDQSFTSQPIEEVLRKSFLNTPYNFAVVDGNRIIITRESTIYTRISDELTGFKNASVRDSTARIDADVFNIESKEATLRSANKVFEIGLKTSQPLSGKSTLNGYVRLVSNSEPVIGALIFIDEPYTAASTNQFGHFTISLPKGRQELNIQSMGIQSTRRIIHLYSDGLLNINVEEAVRSLKEVVVIAGKTANIDKVEMGVEKLTARAIKQVPAVFGEADLLAVVLTLPGVKSAGEASTGFNVRGGTTDQNLILLNDATIYNPSHFFGLFSAFNNEAVKEVELYKSSIPAKFGGRLSSILDVNSREGNKKELSGSAGLGLITSRLNVEGPLIKDKSSFILGGRTTYSNWLMKMLPENSDYAKSKTAFYDLNLNLNHQFSNSSTLLLTAYTSKDESDLGTDTLYGYSNKNLSLAWKKIFHNKLTGVFTSGVDRYQYTNRSDFNPVNDYKLNFDINQYNFKSDFSYFLNSKHVLDFGLNSIYYKLHPGSYYPQGSGSLVKPDVIDREQALESAVYIEDKFQASSSFSVNYGIRYSFFNYLGPQKDYAYAPDLPKTLNNRIDSINHGAGKFIKNYQGPEFRVSARYSLSDDFSVKAGYNTLRQYIHMLSNTTSIAPTDIWKLSDSHIKPQFGDQVSLGFYKNFKSNSIETSVEGYYKNLQNVLDYKSGATLVMNHTIETDVINTQGKAYGIEFHVKKSSGKLNGWMSYTYSRTFLRTSDVNAGEEINSGNYYPSSYDKPHDFSLIGNYRFSHRFSFSLNIAASTGRPITIPIGKYNYAGTIRTLYGDRNGYRIPDYFRSDISFNLDGNHKVRQLTHNSWTFGVYNLTGRKNAYSIYYNTNNGFIQGYKLSIFGTPIPFVNYNIRF